MKKAFYYTDNVAENDFWTMKELPSKLNWSSNDGLSCLQVFFYWKHVFYYAIFSSVKRSKTTLMSHVTNATIPSKANSRLFAMEQTLQHVILRSQNFGRMGNCTSMQIEDARKDYLESLSNGQQAL